MIAESHRAVAAYSSPQFARGTHLSVSFFSWAGYGGAHGAKVQEPPAATVGGGLTGKKVVMITANSWQTCALASTGSVFCWGTGTLGYGRETSDRTKTEPPSSPVNLPRAAKFIDSGPGTTCAIMSDDGAVYCWGSRFLVGFATSQDVNVPTAPVQNLGGPAVHVAVGDFHVCAVLGSGQAKCWGDNEYGQLVLRNYILRPALLPCPCVTSPHLEPCWCPGPHL